MVYLIFLTMLTGLIGSAIGTIGGLFGLFQQNKQEKRAREWNEKVLNTQVAENEKNRQFNSAEAALNRNFQERMQHEANVYNSMPNQVSQMRQAGLNPALAYSSNNFVPMSAPSGSSASSSGNVSGNNYPTYDVINPSIQMARSIAEIENIQAQTRKLNEEGNILESDAKFRDAINSGVVRLNNVEVELKDSQRDLSDKQAAVARVTAQKLDQEIAQVKALTSQILIQTEGNKLDNALKEIDKQYKSQEYEALLKKIASETNRNYAEVNQILTLTPAMRHQLITQGNLNIALRETQKQIAKLYGFEVYVGDKSKDWRWETEKRNLWKLRLETEGMNGFGDAEKGVATFMNYWRILLGGKINIDVPVPAM